MAAAIGPIISILAALAPSAIQAFKGKPKSPGSMSQFGDPEEYSRVSTFDPMQRQLYGQQAEGLGGIQPQIMSYLQQLLSGSPESSAAFEAPYKRQFEEQTVPALAERFAGAGALSSSGFQQALGQAGAGLSENLAALREGQRMQSISPIMQMIQNLLGQQTQAFLPKQPSGWQNFLTGLAPGIGGGVAQGLTQYGLSKFG